MDMELQDKNKRLGIVRFFKSFGFSFQGLAFAVKSEQSFLVMLICLLITILTGLFFNISTLEWVMIFVAIGLVLSTELLNTAIEATIDLVSPEYNPLAKVAKDTASAAVFVYSLVAVIIACLIFIPKIIERI